MSQRLIGFGVVCRQVPQQREHHQGRRWPRCRHCPYCLLCRPRRAPCSRRELDHPPARSHPQADRLDFPLTYTLLQHDFPVRQKEGSLQAGQRLANSLLSRGLTWAVILPHTICYALSSLLSTSSFLWICVQEFLNPLCVRYPSLVVCEHPCNPPVFTLGLCVSQVSVYSCS